MPAGEFRLAHPQEQAKLTEWAKKFHREALQEEQDQQMEKLVAGLIRSHSLYVWYGGQTVAMAARGRETPHGAIINLVYTPPQFRGQGYARAVVAALASHLIAGKFEFCALFTDLANPISNHIYPQIGFKPLCDMLDVRFINPQS